jgi:ATP/maltotriose-dependent transcriptional regulator MalT
VESFVASRVEFVGREAELEVASAAFEAALSFMPQILLVEGEPGIGKTAFVHQFLSSTGDAVVLAAASEETETALDYGVVSQLVSRAAPAPSTAGLSERLGAGSTPNVFSVGADLLALLGSLQDGAPVVVAIDDAHWMDSFSAAALLFALRRLYTDRVMVVIVTRPDGLDHLGASWLRLLNDPQRVRRVRLGSLSGREVGLLAEALGLGQLTLAAAERLREHTGGHPLYIRALLGELPAEALAFDHGPLPAPHSFAATVLARLTGVSPDVQDLIAACAVAGRPCPLTLAGSVAGVRDPLAALDEALASGLLALMPGRTPLEVMCPHPLVRAAIYDDLSLVHRRRLHLAWAQRTSVLVSLEHRVAASPGPDDALAAELAASAEEHIAAGKLLAGIEALLWAWPLATTPEAQDTCLLRAVECLQLAGEVPRMRSLQQAVLACRDGPHKSFIIAILAVAAGRFPEARDELQEVVDRPDFGPHHHLFGRVISSLALVYALLGNGDEAIRLAGHALDSAELTRTAQVTSTQALAAGLLVVGRSPEGVSVLNSASASRIHPEPFEAELLTMRGRLKSWWGDLPGARQDLSTVIRWSRAGALVRSLAEAFGALAEVEYRLGRWDESLAHAEVAVSLAEDTDRAWDLPFVHAVTSYVHASRGSWRIAAEHTEFARRAAEAAPVPITLYYSRVAAAHLAWVRGEWDAVLEALGPLRQRSWSAGWAGLGQRGPWLLEAEATLRSGDLENAARLLDGLEVAVQDGPPDVTLVDFWRLRGLLEHARHRTPESRAAFHNGQVVADEAGSTFAQAELDLAHGHFLRKTRARRAATEALKKARERFEQLQARPFVERCDSELSACGLRARSQDDDYGLTSREKAVAGLVALGKSNREVAAELYLSTKAVEYHLANIFRKLGIRSRHELSSRMPETVA